MITRERMGRKRKKEEEEGEKRDERMDGCKRFRGEGEKKLR